MTDERNKLYYKRRFLSSTNTLITTTSQYTSLLVLKCLKPSDILDTNYLIGLYFFKNRDG